MKKQAKGNIAVVLDNIRSKQNVGSIFRTSDCAGVNKIYLCGTTPCPTDRFGKEVKEISKTALGAQMLIPWEYAKSTITILKKMKKEKFQIIAIEQSKNSIDYRKVKPKNPCAFVVGNEAEGIKKSTLKLCDIIAEISMHGAKESLNVSVAFGAAIFRILNY